jgi:hypothetical protein
MTVSFSLPSRFFQRSARYHSRDYRLSLDQQPSFLPDTLISSHRLREKDMSNEQTHTERANIGVVGLAVMGTNLV